MSHLWQAGRKCLRYKNYDLDYRNMDWLLRYCEDHWPDLPFQKRMIPVNQIVATQEYVSGRTLQHYIRRTRLVDDLNHLPYGVRLPDDPAVYLVDGHHRWVAARIKKRRKLRIQIVELAIVSTEPEPEPEGDFMYA